MNKFIRKPFISWLLRIFNPTYSHCSVCGVPFNLVKPHYIPIDDKNACFPMCEWCWNNKSYEENRYAVFDLYAKWYHSSDGYEDSMPTLQEMINAFGDEWEKTHKTVQEKEV